MTFRSALVILALAPLVVGSAHAGKLGIVVGSIVGTVEGAGPNGGAVVYIEQAPGAFTPAAAKMDQLKMEFVPHILPVLVGTTVTMVNSDPAAHIVLSPDYEKFMVGLGPGQTKDQTFDKCAKFPCVYTLLCPIHPEMEAFIVVLQNPFFAVSTQDGHYVIQNVPEGQYRVGVWHPKLKRKGQAQTVTITAGAPAVLDLSVTK